MNYWANLQEIPCNQITTFHPLSPRNKIAGAWSKPIYIDPGRDAIKAQFRSLLSQATTKSLSAAFAISEFGRRRTPAFCSGLAAASEKERASGALTIIWRRRRKNASARERCSSSRANERASRASEWANERPPPDASLVEVTKEWVALRGLESEQPKNNLLPSHDQRNATPSVRDSQPNNLFPPVARIVVECSLAPKNRQPIPTGRSPQSRQRVCWFVLSMCMLFEWVTAPFCVRLISPRRVAGLLNYFSPRLYTLADALSWPNLMRRALFLFRLPRAHSIVSFQPREVQFEDFSHVNFWRLRDRPEFPLCCCFLMWIKTWLCVGEIKYWDWIVKIY